MTQTFSNEMQPDVHVIIAFCVHLFCVSFDYICLVYMTFLCFYCPHLISFFKCPPFSVRFLFFSHFSCVLCREMSWDNTMGPAYHPPAGFGCLAPSGYLRNAVTVFVSICCFPSIVFISRCTYVLVV